MSVITGPVWSVSRFPYLVGGISWTSIGVGSPAQGSEVPSGVKVIAFMCNVMV